MNNSSTKPEQAEFDLSIIVPLYNEEDSIAPLYEAIKNVINSLNLRHEIIFIDDGSKDETFLKGAA